MKCLILTMFALQIAVLAAPPLLAQGYNIPWHYVGPGGTSADGIYAVTGSAGQWDTGKMTGGNSTLNGGFWVFVEAQAGAAAPYTIADLGTLGGSGADGYPGSEAYGLNTFGQIVGYSYTAGNSNYHGAFWTNGSANPFDLGTLGGDSSEAWAISDSGEIVGDADLAGGGSFHATVWANHSAPPRDLGSLGGDSSAQRVNRSGQIAGYSYTAGDANYRAVYWPTLDSLPLDLGTLGGANSEALGINNSGQIVGDANPAGSQWSHAAFWANGSSVAVDLGTLGNQQSSAAAITDAGQIVGVTAADSFFETQAVFWTNSSSSPVLLATPNGDNSQALGINASGQIVGFRYSGSYSLGSPSQRAVIWTNSSSLAIDLNTLIPANSGWVLQYASAISDSGEIVGDGTLDGQRRGFAMIPLALVPRPAPRITSAVATSGDALALSFTSQLGHTYDILATSDLATGTWTSLLSGIAGTGGIVQIAVPHAFGQPRRFFRVQQAP